MNRAEVVKNRRVKLLSGIEPTGKILDDKNFYGGTATELGPMILVEWDQEPGREALAFLEELALIPDPPDGLRVVLDLLPEPDESPAD